MILLIYINLLYNYFILLVETKILFLKVDFNFFSKTNFKTKF